MMNPILRNELKLNGRTIRVPIILMLYNLVLSCVAVLSIASMHNEFEAGYIIRYTDLIQIFKILGWIQLILVCLTVPVLTASSIAGEREKQTLDIMLTTSVRPFDIVFGKLMGSICTVCLLVVSSIPILSMAFVFGGMDWNDIIYFILIIISISIFVGSIGIFFSSLVKKTPTAIVLTVLFLGILVIGTVLFFPIIQSIYETVTYNANTNSVGKLDISSGGILMICNPIILFYDFMEKSMGAEGVTNYLSSLFDVQTTSLLYTFAQEWWIVASLIVQLGCSLLLLVGASFFLHPLKRREKGYRPKWRKKK